MRFLNEVDQYPIMLLLPAHSILKIYYQILRNHDRRSFGEYETSLRIVARLVYVLDYLVTVNYILDFNWPPDVDFQLDNFVWVPVAGFDGVNCRLPCVLL